MQILKKTGVEMEDGSFQSENGLLKEYSGEENRVTIPDDIEEIADGAFSENEDITEVILSDGTEKIGKHAFKDCVNLKKVVFGKSFKQAEIAAFEGCVKLNEFSVTDENNKYIGEGGILFSEDKKKLIRFPMAKKCENYQIPEEVVRIEDGAFYGALYLKKIVIPDGVSYIGDSAFAVAPKEGIVKIIMPESVARVGENVFNQSCDIVYLGDADDFESIKKDEDIICRSIQFDDEEQDERDFIQEVTEEVTEKIVQQDFEEDYYEISYNEYEDGFSIDEEGVLLDCVLEESELYLPDGVRKIVKGALDSGIKMLRAEEGLLSLEEECFAGFEELEEIYLPESLETIGKEAFRDCFALKKIHFSGTKKEWKAIEKGNFWKKDAGSFTVECSDGNISKLFA